MIELKHFLSINELGQDNLVTIASGPVIIKDGKVLLDKHGDIFWKFPGGAWHSDNNFEQNAINRVKEELNVEVKLLSEPYLLSFVRQKDGKDELVILIHYLAEIVAGEITPGPEVVEFAWHDINNLPDDCAPNIKLVVEYFKLQI